MSAADELQHRIEQETERRRVMHPVARLLQDVPRAITIVLPRMIGTFKFRVRVAVNRALRGYDELDWWEYASQNSSRAVILLGLLKKNGHGFTCMQTSIEHDCWDGTCQRLWNEALDDMIFFHEIVAGDTTRRLNLIQGSPDHERFERGRAAYAKHYESLWD